ncbi:MAG: PLDc N-terminal domain-containing protein [Oscillospiraceae bacterium]|nr:PLDc N-terminal domain-containing protein [Oscillospiraceae bacterium]
MDISVIKSVDGWEEFWELCAAWLPIILPLAAIQFGLIVFAVVDIAKKRRTKNLSPVAWVLIVCLLSNLGLGAILYFILGRSDTGVNDETDLETDDI